MSSKTIEVYYDPSKVESIDKCIKDILDRGDIVVFTNKITGVVKKVDTWNKDDMGDFTAFESTGSTLYVCPYVDQYTITEEVK